MIQAAQQHVQSMGNGAFRLPDGSIAYTAKRAAEELKKIKPVEYTASDLILLLLSSQDRPIVGRALLFREIFIFEREVLAGADVEDCKFVPHYYGPYSFYMACKIREMSRMGLIEISRAKGTAEYALTQKGFKKARARRRAVPAGLDASMRKFRKGLDQHGATHILEAIYRRAEYAEYVERSGVAHRYKAITGGAGCDVRGQGQADRPSRRARYPKGRPRHPPARKWWQYRAGGHALRVQQKGARGHRHPPDDAVSLATEAKRGHAAKILEENGGGGRGG